MAWPRLDRRSTIVLLVALCMGCSNRIPTVPVSGTVTLADGQPIAGATVSMESLDRTTSGTARTDEAGRFVMSTHQPGDGLPRGTYRAVVLPPVPVDVDVFQPPAFNPKYSRYETSGLELTIDQRIDDLDIRLNP